ncbi:MAG: MATE family efflux transporter [Tannerella sp.]|nr:MATE family efflux transporter [Tannerella sp.]
MSNEITWRLEHEKPARLLLKYAIPAVVGTMVNSLYNIVDRIYIGHGVGSLAISGLTLTFPMLLLLQAFGMLVGVGASSRISIFLGKKDLPMAEKILGNALLLTFAVTTLTVIPCMIWLEELLTWFGGSEHTIPYAVDYLCIVIPGNIFTSLSFSYNSIIRASGYPKKAMMTMIVGAVMNILLDPIFIFRFDMGIRGAAVATVISMAVSAALVMWHFVSRKSLIRFRRHGFRFDRRVVWYIVTIGISPFLMQLAGSLVNVIMNHSLQIHGGDLALGANGIIVSFGMLLVMLVVGIAQGMQPIVGFNYGAGHTRRVMETFRLVVITATCVMGAGWLCSLCLPEVIVRAFTSEQALIDITANGLRLNLLAFVVVGSHVTLTHFFQSIGDTGKSIFLSLSRQVLFLIPFLLILPSFFGLDGVWYAGPLSDTLSALIAWLFLWHHVRKHR